MTKRLRPTPGFVPKPKKQQTKDEKHAPNETRLSEGDANNPVLQQSLSEKRSTAPGQQLTPGVKKDTRVAESVQHTDLKMQQGPWSAKKQLDAIYFAQKAGVNEKQVENNSEETKYENKETAEHQHTAAPKPEPKPEPSPKWVNEAQVSPKPEPKAKKEKDEEQQQQKSPTPGQNPAEIPKCIPTGKG